MTAIQWQRYGIISDYLLAELKSAAYSFLFTLHTAAEFFLVGIERLARLEQVKARKCEVIISTVAVGRLTLCWSWSCSGR